MKSRTSTALPENHELLSHELTTAGLPSNANENATKLNISVEHAQTRNWLWLACAVSVHNYFSPDSPVTQCQVASQITGQSCCSSPMPDACNVERDPSAALRALNNLNRVCSARDFNFSDVQNEILAGRPLILSVSSPGVESGRVIVLFGIDDASNVYVMDPQTGTARANFMDIANFYCELSGEVSFTQR
ncbi:Peptidase_C39 like family protein [Chitinophaga eiseniae]|uniref:Peptidase_C39 like family protein n=1 Tax=Chitinophaga eiseniae TaxID=634771 RepID=A0A1T4MKE7_9BACT|nr:papain-like cysteine protease family protein [Chitinophaga eiseniae]SJZ67423.1 Peptidase_C39 like family protein [Chitinophaga eiseniae]